MSVSKQNSNRKQSQKDAVRGAARGQSKKVKVVTVKLNSKKQAKQITKKVPGAKTKAALRGKQKSAEAVKAKSAKTSVAKQGRVASKEKDTKKLNIKAVEQTKVLKKAENKSEAKRAEKIIPTKAKNSSEKKPTQLSVEIETVPVRTEFPQSPSAQLLRPFREMAKQNKKQRREKEKQKTRSAEFLKKANKKGKRYTFDLRVHSPASEGYFSTGGVDPAPAMVRLARVKGLDIIALTDYYHASYIDLLKAVSSNSPVTVIPGLDLKCKVGACDEVSMIALFPQDVGGDAVFGVLDRLRVPKGVYGSKNYVLDVDFDTVLEVIEGLGGILIPSRVDKTPYRHLAITTLVESYGFRAFDLVHPENLEFFQERWPDGGFTFFSFSNANALGQIGSRSAKLKLSSPDFQGIKELCERYNKDSDVVNMDTEVSIQSIEAA